jgi:cell division protein FtsW
LLSGIVVLAGFGLVMVYSASAVTSFSRHGSDLYLAQRQAAYLGLGMIALWLGARVDYAIYRKLAYPILLFSVLLLVLVLVPGIGTKVGGARRWFRMGGLSFQPAEFAKLALAVYLAVSAANKGARIGSFSVGFLPHLIVSGALVTLVLAQPDLGTAMLLMGLTLVVLFVAGTRLLYIVAAVLAVAPVAWWAIVGTSWRMQRLLAFFEPEAHKVGAGYQIYESMVTLGSGGWLGLGLGQGRQKLFYLPEGHTDFILPVIGQELGFVGVAILFLLVGVIVWRGARTALRARDLFGTYLAFGITSLFACQTFVNMAVVMAVLPTKGLTLPLVSFGGSSLVMTLFGLGVLLNISRRMPEPQLDPKWQKAQVSPGPQLNRLRRWAFSRSTAMPLGGGRWRVRRAAGNKRVRRR